MKKEKLINFSTDVPEKIAEKFDRIAEKHFRSRAQQLKFIVLETVRKENQASKQ